jgi:hypothetical protein
MALIPAAQQMLAIFLAAIVLGGLICWIAQYAFGKLWETLF